MEAISISLCNNKVYKNNVIHLGENKASSLTFSMYQVLGIAQKKLTSNINVVSSSYNLHNICYIIKASQPTNGSTGHRPTYYIHIQLIGLKNILMSFVGLITASACCWTMWFGSTVISNLEEID